MMRKETRDRLRKLYEDPSASAGYSSVHTLLREARTAGLKVGRKEIAAFLEEYPSHTKFADKVRPHISTPVVGFGHSFQADLGFYPSYNRLSVFLIWLK